MLEQVEYVLAMRWNDRAGRWFFELSDSTGALITARKVVPNWPLLFGLVQGTRPPGELIAVDTLQLDTPIGFDDWGDRVALNYFDAAEVAALVAQAGP
jgi:hypothetical protein